MAASPGKEGIGKNRIGSLIPNLYPLNRLKPEDGVVRWLAYPHIIQKIIGKIAELPKEAVE